MNINLIIGPIIGIVLSLLIKFGVSIPIGMTAASLSATAALLIALYTSLARLQFNDAKVWWKSRVIWTHISSAGVAVLALFSVQLGIPPEQLAEMGLALASGLGLIFGLATKKASD